MSNSEPNDETLTNKEIDELAEFLTPSWEKTNTKSTSQSIYSSDSLTNSDSKLEILSLEELFKKDFPPNKYIVDRLIPENGITCISGKPKVGKSFWTLDLAICIALGVKYLNEFDTQQGGVLFISKEDPQRLIQERSRLLTSIPEIPLHFCTEPRLYLDTDQFLEEVLEIIKEKEIKVVIIDSFRRIFKGEENSSQVISEVQNRFKVLLEYGISIIFIHHHGKEGFFKREAGDKLRGSSDILAMLDSLLIVERKDDLTLKVTQGALRSDKPLNPFLVKFPDFDQKNSSFTFLNYIEDEIEKIDQAKEDILILLSSGQHNQKEIIQKLILGGKYGPTTVKNALKELLEIKKLDCITQGNKKIYLLFDQTEQDEESE